MPAFPQRPFVTLKTLYMVPRYSLMALSNGYFQMVAGLQDAVLV